MRIGVLRESQAQEARVGLTPEVSKKLTKAGFKVQIEKGAGLRAGLPDRLYEAAGAQIVSSSEAGQSDIVLKVQAPSAEQMRELRSGALLLALVEPYNPELCLKNLAQNKMNVFSLEKVPRISRAQSMDVLSSQANIAGYRAVLEAAVQYPRFFPMMMTSAGMARPAKVFVLGVGVAGLQAIATARRLGATVEAYDVRPEVKEQIQSLGAKPIEIHIGEEGSGQGGYAKELSEEAKRKQQELLAEYLKKADVILTTANVPGRKAPVLVPESVVAGMKPGSVILDMAAATGGNCAVTKKDEVVVVNDVRVVGFSNYPSMVAESSSQFFAQNLYNILMLLTRKVESKLDFNWDFQDEIIRSSVVCWEGELRL